MTPSPNHLAIRTPRREQISRSRDRKAESTSTACSSPSRSVRAVKPETSTKAKLRWTRTDRWCHVFQRPSQSRRGGRSGLASPVLQAPEEPQGGPRLVDGAYLVVDQSPRQ